MPDVTRDVTAASHAPGWNGLPGGAAKQADGARIPPLVRAVAGPAVGRGAFARNSVRGGADLANVTHRRRNRRQLQPPTPSAGPRPRFPRWLVWSLAAFGLGSGALLLLGIVGVFAALKQSDAYRTSLAFVGEHPASVARLGRPITGGFFPTGSIEKTGPFGRAELSFSVHGPRGDGTALVRSSRDGVRWVVQDARLVIDGGVLELPPPPPSHLAATPAGPR